MRGSTAIGCVLALALAAGCDSGSLAGWVKNGDPAGGGSPGGGGPPTLVDAGPGGGGGDPGGGDPAPDPGGGETAPDSGPAGGGGTDAGTGAIDPSDPCMGLDYLGTCDGDTARWCENGSTLRERDCAASGERCGWVDDTTGYYCGGTVGGGPGGGSPPPDPGGGDTMPPPTTGCGTAVEQENLRLVNEARASAGLGELRCDEGLTLAARLHSQDMCDRDYFDHTSADGRSFTDRIDAQGVSYGTAGENIAWGQRDAREVHESWMSSSGHRANILGGSYRRIGIGHVECGGSPYWTQDFTD